VTAELRKIPKKNLPPVLPTMARSMEHVCVWTGILLWRWLGKRCHMSYHYSVITHFRELFDCPMFCCDQTMWRSVNRDQSFRGFCCANLQGAPKMKAAESYNINNRYRENFSCLGLLDLGEGRGNSMAV
jgi:hypothetical protein